ncbi:acyl-ACP desaturase [Antrihabitans sp. YC2-6]|nr:acyl-ACP desaturase [Antrihabitans sp. YC2-6]MBJ8343759.1 acyl-ACP desaturase [Antrihabitans sp. YC2-6]
MNDGALLSALAPVVDDNLRRHVAESVVWEPHDFVPFDEGRNYAFMGGDDWSPEQSTLSDVGKLALSVSLLAADNMPSFHRELAYQLRTGPWWRWVGRWTAEENRHAIVLRNYLVVTRAVDPVELERVRMAHMTANFRYPSMGLLQVLANAAFDETASSIRHRNSAGVVGEPLAASICNRIALDDELQRTFYANILTAALEVVPDQVVRAVADAVKGFRIPLIPLPNNRDSTAELAAAGIYDPTREAELVFAPLLEHWNIFDRTDLGEQGQQAQQELTALRVS